MGKNSSKTSKGVPSRAGDRKHKFAGFFARATEKKIRNIMKSAGRDAAEKWADAHDARLAFLKVTRG